MDTMTYSDYIDAVAGHLRAAGKIELMPSYRELTNARNNGVSPRKFAEWWMRRNA